MNINNDIKSYVINSYLYYIRFEDCLIADYEFDFLCKRLADNYDSVPEEYKSIINLDSLTSGTGFDLNKKDYALLFLMLGIDPMRGYK